MRYPKVLLVEVTNRCNADCVICGRSWWRDRPLGNFDFDLYTRLIDQLESVDKVCLNQYGEPLLYPRLVDAVAYAKSRGKYVWTTTNGQRLDEELATALLQAGLDKLIFSVDHVTKREYEAHRIHLDWDVVNANIDRFRALRDAGNYPTEIIMSVTRSTGTSTTDEEYRRFWAKRVDGVGFSNEVDVSPIVGTIPEGKPISCERPQRALTVRVDGEVVLCCRDCHTLWSFGNVNDQDPLEIFNAPKFELVRVSIADGRGCPAMCQGCRGFWVDRRAPVRPPIRP